jgi:mono/diheme cytochrome c family protein
MTTPHLSPRMTMLLAAAALIGLLVPPVAAAGDPAAGKPLFEANCATCHGTSGKGDGPVGIALQPRPRDFTQADFLYDTDGDGQKGTDADLKNIITNGAAKYGGSPLMAPWPTLTPQQIENIIAYVRTFHD